MEGYDDRQCSTGGTRQGCGNSGLYVIWITERTRSGGRGGRRFRSGGTWRFDYVSVEVVVGV